METKAGWKGIIKFLLYSLGLREYKHHKHSEEEE